MIRTMLLTLFCALMVFTTLPVIAQEELNADHQQLTSVRKPYSRVEVRSQEVTVGTPAKVKIKLFVPTQFKEQPEFPSFDGINVIVKALPQSLPKAEKGIDGTRWSMISQEYWLLPMASGEFSFESSQASAVYANPSDNSAISVDLTVGSFSFSGAVPDAAKGLNPLIIAKEVTLEQSWHGAVDSMNETEAVTRTVMATIDGSSALFLPKLILPLSSIGSDLVKAYPQQQIVADTEPYKGLGGKREESVSYVAQYGGKAEYPAIEIKWFNTNTGKIETASVAGRTLVINAPKKPTLLTKKQLIVLCGILAILSVIIWSVKKWLYPVLKNIAKQKYLSWQGSERYAARRVIKSIQNHDLDEVYLTFELWYEHCDFIDSSVTKPFFDELLNISQERFGKKGKADWLQLERIFRQVRKVAKPLSENHKHKALPTLNLFDSSRTKQNV